LPFFTQVIEGLETCTAMKSLWLGKNKIEAIAGLENLTALKQLDIQHNRLTTLGEGVRHLQQLEELYLAWNAIDSLQGLPDRLVFTFCGCCAFTVVTSAEKR
jgi:Leucine-rich repeat (LRR) protein